MAFNINAQVVLSGPKNIQKVRSSIQKQLSGVTVSVDLKVDKNNARNLTALNQQVNALNAGLATLNKNAKSTASTLSTLSNSASSINKTANNLGKSTQKVNKSLQQTEKQVSATASEIEAFGKDAALAIRRFSAFTIATGAVFGFIRAVQQGVKEAIAFERELARIVQVTGKTQQNLQGLTSTIDELAVSLGLDANRLLEVSRIFAQTGQSIEQVEKSIRAVARATLAPTFGDIEKTTEGVIAALNQFSLSADRAESVLGSLNAVSKSFAVESDDLISAIRRAGGVFAASTTQLGAPEERLRELLGIFTAVRSTTRESADTIATGLRTIFTRIQRPQTIKFLEQFGVQLRATAEDADRLNIAQGDFVGIFEALNRVSGVVGKLDTLGLAQLVEELGGVRQVGKLLPALREFAKAEEARKVALEGTESISKDVAIATQTLAVQLEQVQQKFNLFIRDVANSDTFQNLARFAISAANAFITLADTLRPLIPLLTTVAGIKITTAAFGFARGFIGGFGKGGAGVGDTLASTITGSGPAASAQKQSAQAAQNNTKSVNTNTNTLKNINSTVSKTNSAIASLQNAINNLSSNISRMGASTVALGAARVPRRRSKGGPIPKFASGGYVDGPSHAQGGVLAELEGGEFVVPKKFAAGGGLKRFNLGNLSPGQGKLKGVSEKQVIDYIEGRSNNIAISDFKTKQKIDNQREEFKRVGRAQSEEQVKNVAKLNPNTVFGLFLLPDSNDPTFRKKLTQPLSTRGNFKNVDTVTGRINAGTLEDKPSRRVRSSISTSLVDSVVSSAASTMREFEIKPFDIDQDKVAEDAVGKINLRPIEGLIFEAFISAISGLRLPESDSATFDFPSPTLDQLNRLENIFKPDPILGKVGEAKRTFSRDVIQGSSSNSISNKILAGIASGKLSSSDFSFVSSNQSGGLFAAGGTTRSTAVSVSNGELFVPPDVADRFAQELNAVNSGKGVPSSLLSTLLGSGSSVISGPGTGTSDSIKTSLPEGSFIVNAKDTRRLFNKDSINARSGGRISRHGLARGGGVSGGLGAIQGLSNLALILGIASNIDVSSFEDLKNTILNTSVAFGILAESVRENSKEQDGQSTILGRFRKTFDEKRRGGGTVAGSAAKSARQFLPSRSSIGKLFKGARGISIAGIASLLAGPAIEGISSQFLGEKEQLGRFSGRSENTEVSKFTTGLSKLVSGGLAGAAVGGLFGPVGAAVGGAVGGAGGAILGGINARREQESFEALKDLSSAAEGLASAFKGLEGASISNLDSLTKATSKIAFFNDSLINTTSRLEAISNRGGFVGAVNNITEAFSIQEGIINKLQFAFASTIGITGSPFSRLEERSASFLDRTSSRVSDQRGALAFSDSLSQLSDEAIAGATNQSSRVVDQLFSSLSLQDLESISLDSNNTFKELTSVLATTTNQTKEFKKQLELLRELETTQIAGQLKSGISSFANDFSKGVSNAATNSTKTFLETFEKSGDIQKASQVAIKQFSESVAEGELNPDEAIKATQALGRLYGTISTNTPTIAANVKEQERLNRIAAKTTREIDALASAIETLGGGLSVAASDFELALSNSLARLQNPGAVRQRANVFSNRGIGRSSQDFAREVNNIREFIGGDRRSFQDLPSTVQLGNQLPQAIKGALESFSAADTVNAKNVFEAISQRIGGFGNLSEPVRKSLQNSIERVFVGREGNKGVAGLEEALTSQGGIGGLVEVSGKVAEELERASEAVNSFRNNIQAAGNIQSQATDFIANAEKTINSNLQNLFDLRERIAPSGRTQSQINSNNLRSQLNTLLNAGGAAGRVGGPAVGDVTNARELLDRRSFLRDRITVASGIRDSSNDPAAIAQLSTEIADLGSALKGTEEALSLIANDTTQLVSLEKDLLAVNESRLTNRQRLSAFSGRLAEARNPLEALQIQEKFFKPVVAAVKANQGIGLNPQEAAALNADVLSNRGGLTGSFLGIENNEKLLERSRTNAARGIFEGVVGGNFGGAPVGRELANRVFGGAALNERGQDPRERQLLARGRNIIANQNAAAIGVGRQNAEAAQAELQRLLKTELDATNKTLQQTTTAFQNLRGELGNLLGGQLPNTIPGADGSNLAGGRVSGNQQGGVASAAQQLNAAAEKLANLPELKIQLEANVGTIDVVLNGASLLSQFGDKVKAEVLEAVSDRIRGLVPNPDGSTPDPTLSSGGSPRFA